MTIFEGGVESRLRHEFDQQDLYGSALMTRYRSRLYVSYLRCFLRCEPFKT